jgi:preprotein translocase subunit SecD
MATTARRIFASELMGWIVLAGLGVYFLLPLRQSIRLGMDLAGGTYLTLQVQTEKAVEADLAEKMKSVDEKLKRAGKELPLQKIIEGNAIVLSFASINDAQIAASQLKTEFVQMKPVQDGTTLRLELSEKAADAIKEDAVLRDIEVLRLRLDKVGVADIPIAKSGERNIIVELPDVQDPQQAKAMIGTAALLEFRIVDRAGRSPEEILLEYDGELPAGKEILPGSGQDKGYYLVEKYADVTGKMLKSASATFDQQKLQHYILFGFTDEGGERFGELTGSNIGRRLAIVLDDIVISAPTIQSKITNEGSITGDFTPEQARELALLLKSGAFVAPVTFEEDRTIGPSLGAESIKQGLLACLVGMVLLLIFSILYYRLSGLFAFIALIYNLLFILVGMWWLGATLTMPGIGGLLLTVGMAIDASILIYERIKEELAAGVTVNKAVKDGFSDAMAVILDANITTFVVGVVLYYFGTGPIQGFAVTMMLGIIATLVTGLFFLRSIFKFYLNNFHVTKLSI